MKTQNLPQTTALKNLEGLHEIKERLDESKTTQQGDGFGGSIFNYKSSEGETLLSVHKMADDQGTIYKYKGRDCEGNAVEVELIDYDNDGNIDRIEEKYSNNRTVAFISQNDDGNFDEYEINGETQWKREPSTREKISNFFKEFFN